MSRSNKASVGVHTWRACWHFKGCFRQVRNDLANWLAANEHFITDSGAEICSFRVYEVLALPLSAWLTTSKLTSWQHTLPH